MTMGPNLVNVQTFEFGESGFWTKMDVAWIRKHAHLRLLVGSTPKLFFAWFLSIRRCVSNEFSIWVLIIILMVGSKNEWFPQKKRLFSVKFFILIGGTIFNFTKKVKIIGSVSQWKIFKNH